MKCEICKFENPKSTVTAIILRGNSLLILKRNEEPYKGKWDLPGGYMNKEEASKEALEREVKEELSVVPRNITLVGEFPGYGYWQKETFPILSLVYLVDIGDQEITLNAENSEYTFMPLKTFDPGFIAWDSNQRIVSWIKQNFTFDLARVKELVKQLDPQAEVKEQSLYRAVIEGRIVAVNLDGKLVGMGWLYPRQTMLRHQAVVEDMIVDEAYRGKGLGKALLTKLLELAKELGVEVVELTTNPKRVAANELYKSFGFKLHKTNHYLLNL